jgi:hypothetical protein
VVAPRGLTEPFRVAENAATLVAGLAATTGVGVEVGAGVGVGLGVDVGVGVGDALATTTVPTMPQHPPCGTQ